MDNDELVRNYIDAWNRLDVAAMLELMHPGTAYYDAYWMESCVGRDLKQYLQDSIDEDPLWYEQVGDTIATENGVAYRYGAHKRSASRLGQPECFGAEILCVQDGRILTVTDIYCSPNPAELKEVALLAAKRHGLSCHADSGFGALKAARIKANLSTCLANDKVYLDLDFTMTQLAKKIDCTLDQLAIVIKNQFGSNLAQVLDTRRIEHAKSLLEREGIDPHNLETVAASSGFASVGELKKKFSQFAGVAPIDYYYEARQRNESTDNLRAH